MRINLISLITLDILPALVPILAPLLALTKDPVSLVFPDPLSSSSLLPSYENASIIGSISVIKENEATKSSQNQRPKIYSLSLMLARQSSRMKQIMLMIVMIVKASSASFVVNINRRSSPRRAYIVMPKMKVCTKALSKNALIFFLMASHFFSLCTISIILSS